MGAGRSLCGSARKIQGDYFALLSRRACPGAGAGRVIGGGHPVRDHAVVTGRGSVTGARAAVDMIGAHPRLVGAALTGTHGGVKTSLNLCVGSLTLL